MSDVLKEVVLPRPEIYWKGKDVTEFLYGPSVLIPAPRGIRPWNEDLEEIKSQVRQASGEVGGVSLKVIDDPSELKAGDLLLNIHCAEKALIKSLIRITEIKEGVIYTRCVWPEYDSGFEGFFRAKNLIEVDSFFLSFSFIYKGRIPEKPLNPSLYERVAELQSDLGVLIECWAMVKNSEFQEQNLFSFDPYEYFWRSKFREENGDKFQHDKIWKILSSARESADLSTIEEVFYQQETDLDRWVSPLLEQMQYEILTELRDKPELTEKIFSEQASEFWQKRMKVLFERYYGPKEMVFVAEVASGKETPRAGSIDEKTRKKLDIIEKIINGGTQFEGLRQAAKAAWERLTGKPYQDRIEI